MSEDARHPNEDNGEQTVFSEFAGEHPILTFSGGILLYVIAGVVLFILLNLYVDPGDSTQKKDVIQALGLVMAGLAGIIGVYFTWQNLRTTRENTDKQVRQAQASTQATLDLAERGQITERFTRAIELLGETYDDRTKKLEARLGGIYALERFAKDSRKPEDNWTVMEILTTYAKQHVPWPPRSPEDQPFNFSNLSSLGETRPDIQALLTVVGRRNDSQIATAPTELDLSETNLRIARLSDANLQKARLSRARLEGADLTKARLQGADLFNSHLECSVLSKAHLGGADLTGAYLQGADLVDAHLEGATLWDAHLEGANLQGAHLLDANILNASMNGADVRGADLRVNAVSNLNDEIIRRTIGDNNTKLSGLNAPGWWDQAPPKGQFLENGSYVTRAFAPALSFTVEEYGWYFAEHDPWMLKFEWVHDYSLDQLQAVWGVRILNPRFVEFYGMANPNTEDAAPLTQDLRSWYEGCDCFTIGPPIPTTVGGVDGLQFDCEVSTVPKEQPRYTLQPSVRIFRTPDAMVVLSEGGRFRITELMDVRGERVFIIVGGKPPYFS